MRDRTGGYDPTVKSPGVLPAEHYCQCSHLRLQHGRTAYDRSRPGCWWCKCAKEHADYRAAVEKARAS